MNKIRLIRVNKNLTQIELAVKSGVSLQTIKFLESGFSTINNCKFATLEKIAKALGVSVGSLF